MQYNDAVDRFIHRRWVFCALATSVTLVAYIGAVYGDFQFDDSSTILEESSSGALADIRRSSRPHGPPGIICDLPS